MNPYTLARKSVKQHSQEEEVPNQVTCDRRMTTRHRRLRFCVLVVLAVVPLTLSLVNCTQNVSYYTPTPTPTRTLKPTAIRPTATSTPTTMTHFTPTSTSIPTATGIPTPKPLAEQMGFSDMTIQGIQENFTDCRIIQQRETSLLSDNYIASIIECRELSHLLVYKHEIHTLETNHYLALKVSDADICFQCGGISGENWQDVDGDGLSDLIVGHGTNHYWATYIYRMTNGGELEGLLEACPFNIAGGAPSFSDVNQDGIWEITVTDTQWDYDQTDIGWYIPSIIRVYSIQGCEYRDVSASFPEFYQHTIDVFFRNHEHVLASGFVRSEATVFSAFDGLLACDAIGKRDECWLAFWEMTDLDKHRLESMIGSYDVTPDASTLRFMEWVNELRTILKQQYEAGLPFSPETP
jgi:hypothetical protein